MKRRNTFFWCLPLIGLMLSVTLANAQTFPGNTVNTAGNSLIPSVGTGGCTIAPQTTGGTIFLNPVAGLAAGTGLLSIQVNFTHTFDADVDMYLRAPNGQILELSTDNGGGGDNFTNTVFCDNAPTNITAGAPPYTGTFRPEGTLTSSTCGTNITPTVTTLAGFAPGQNGNWELVFKDDLGGDIGTMLGWSLSFGGGGCTLAGVVLPPVTVAGNDPAICGATNVPLTAPSLPACPAQTLAVFVDGVFFGNVLQGSGFVIPGPLSVGTHTIRYQLSACDFTTQTLIITDGVDPVITCPGDFNINLDPGLCSQIINYDVTATDNCPSNLVGFYAIPDTNIALGGQSLSCQPGAIINHYFQVVSGFNGNYTTGFVRVGIVSTWPAGSSAAATLTARLYTLINPAQPYNVSSTNRVLIGTSAPFAVPAGSANQKRNIPISVNIPAGATVLIEVQSSHPFVVATPAGTGTRTWLASIPCGISPLTPATFISVGFALDMYAILYAAQPIITPTQISGLPSGSAFPIGTTTNCFEAVDNAGNVSQCCFDVTVLEFPNPTSTLVCNDLVTVSLDEDCFYCLGADDVLEGGPYGCYDDYIVEVDKTPPFGNGPWQPACFGPADIGKTYQVRVTDPDTGNKCWGNVKIEDKLPPVLDCPEVSLPCNADISPEVEGPIQTPASVNINIAAAGTTTVNFDFTGPDAPIEDLDISFVTDHTWVGDINATLTSPSGTQVVFFDRPGIPVPGGLGCANDGLDVSFDDESATPYAVFESTCGNNPAIAGDFQPLNPLSAFDGENPNGTWTLAVQDFVGGDGGPNSTLTISILQTGGAGFPNQLDFPFCVFPTGVPQQYIVPAGCGVPQLDNCSDVTLSYIDTHVPQDCASGLTEIVLRKWTARDASNNTATCIQTINLLRPTLDDVTLPPDYDGIDAPYFLCTDNSYPTPDWIEGLGLQGWPYVFGQPVGCSINWAYEDIIIDVCDGTYKIRRVWSIIDWCIGAGFEYNQIIKVIDEEGPSIACPANITVSTDPFTCCATTDLPDVIISDNCSRINNVSAMVVTFDPQTGDQLNMYQFAGSLTSFPGNNIWNPDTLAQFGYTPCLPLGTHVVTYVAEDDCGNTSSCTFRVTVRDYTPPVAACQEFTTVAIGIDDPFDCYGPAGPNGTPPALDACTGAGVTWVRASSFDSGSYDNCGPVYLTIQRMGPDYSQCILDLNTVNGHPDCADQFPDFPSEFERAVSEGDSIKFYCCEVGLPPQTVILTVYQLDAQGNITVGPDGTPVANQCMIQVEVQDKIKPVCVPPVNMSVSCENFDPSLWAYGKAIPYDNCCLDTTQVYQGQCGLSHTANYSLFDTVCNKGTITRTFRAWDCHGFTSQCTQRVFVSYEQEYWLRFPNDVIVTVCDGTGNYGEPTFNKKDCELLGVSFEDEIFTVVPDACFKIERTWTIINWCTYDPNLPCIYVPNPNPNPITNHPTNLPGPTVSPCGTPAPWAPTVVKIAPSDPTTTNYCIFYDADANCYKYKQIIKVIDTQAPTVDCPPSPQTFCDLTVNDPLLWNEMYWWDGVISSHDLCEGPTDLQISASDDCSLANITIEYLLFLDLDGNGTMETVISSTNLPGVNNVFYNNAFNPNFGGGVPRQFDERGLPLNLQYRFGIDRIKSGDSRIAAVRWFTLAQENAAPANETSLTGTIPELPYGTHKIKWLISDGCGNQTVCEYTFIVKDCKPPTVVCINGLSVNIMPTGMITLWATDFLQYAEDNCTPPTFYTPGNQLKYAIRKSGDGTGFPVDAFGQPITNVTFTCDELGTQTVELWAQDAAGNAAYCETYVIVQDPFNNCTGNPISVAGALKTETQQGVEEGGVELDGSHPALPPVNMFDLSDQVGDYMFSNALPMLADYTVTPTKDDNPMNGVSTFDLVLMSKHILGIEPLNSPYKIIAADVNKSNSVTTFDIVELRKLILGIYTELPNNTSWRFLDKGFQFGQPNNPFASVPFAENKTIADVSDSQLGDDFVGIKIGDLNGSVVPNANAQSDDRTAGTLLLDVEDRTVAAGEVFDVTFKTAEAAQGFQFTLNLNGLEVADITEQGKVTAANFGVFADALTTSIDGAGEFTVKFRAAKAGKLSEMLQLSSRITRSEAYSLSNDRLDVALRFSGQTIAGVGFELYQNQPNPWIGKTQVGFHLPAAASATLTVFDETGRVLFTQQGDYAKGYNVVTLDRSVLNTVGVLYYKLETATDNATRKMIQSK